MEENLSFLDKLHDCINKKRENIETSAIIKLKETLSIFQTYFENVYNILLRKSLIQEDPYKYDEKISEVTVPSSENVSETERQDILSQRISKYHSQLDFLNNYYQFSLNFLNIDRIKRIIALIKYFNWLNVSSSSSDIVTRYLGELMMKIKMGTDNISTQIISDSLSQIEKNVRTILTILESIYYFLKEEYKLLVRTNVLTNIDMNSNVFKGDPEISTKAIKRVFSKFLPDLKFNPNFIKEILFEENDEKGAELKKAIITKLTLKSDNKKKNGNKTSFKTILLQGVRILASSGFQIEDAITKLNDNNLTYNSRKMSIGERLKRWFQKLIQRKNIDAQIFEIDYFDVNSSSTRTEKINFTTFMNDLQKRSKLYGAVTNKASSTYSRLEASTEEKIYEFLKKNIVGLQLTHRRLASLNEFFKSEVPKEKRSKIRRINVELNAVKNSIIKANKKKHDYVARKEEQEQMKRLGIKVKAE